MGRGQLRAPSSQSRQTDVGSTRIWSAEQSCRWCVDNYKQIGRAIALQKGSQILSAFGVLKRQVDDSETVRQLAATGQDRGDGGRLPKACCGILKIILGRNARKKLQRCEIILGAENREQPPVEYVPGEFANSKALVVTYPSRCRFGNDETR